MSGLGCIWTVSGMLVCWTVANDSLAAGRLAGQQHLSELRFMLVLTADSESHPCRQTNQMLKTYATMSQRVRPRKAAERGVTVAAAVVREKWGALQHLYNQLQSLPENPAKGEGNGNDEIPSAALEAAYAAASADQADQPSASG